MSAGNFDPPAEENGGRPLAAAVPRDLSPPSAATRSPRSPAELLALAAQRRVRVIPRTRAARFLAERGVEL